MVEVALAVLFEVDLVVFDRGTCVCSWRVDFNWNCRLVVFNVCWNREGSIFSMPTHCWVMVVQFCGVLLCVILVWLSGECQASPSKNGAAAPSRSSCMTVERCCRVHIQYLLGKRYTVHACTIYIKLIFPL